jgi:hypothetical protein
MVRKPAMPTDLLPPLTYTDVELESYLPSGWLLADGEEPSWDESESAFHAKVVDGSWLDWDLWVPKADADRHGRIEALRRAVDKLDRERFKSFL